MKSGAAHSVQSEATAWSYGVVSHREIDAWGLTEANRAAFVRALQGLYEPVAHALVDGKYQFQLPVPTTFMVGGDRSEFLIAAASILAKVFRDRLMRAAHMLYPDYRFDRHKGYGTAFHQRMVRAHGITSLHRKSFFTKFIM